MHVSGAGYRVIVAGDGQEALEVFKANAGLIDLLIMDVVMPFLSGPDAYLIFTTGYTPEATAVLSLIEKDATILQKPYSLSSLSQIVRGTLEHQPPAVIR